MPLALRLVGLTAVAIPFYLYRAALLLKLSQYTSGNPFWILVGALLTTALACFANLLILGSSFVWNCFLRPLGKTDSQKGRLDAFYKGQAHIYDETRKRLLKGRTTMLKLSAAHLKVSPRGARGGAPVCGARADRPLLSVTGAAPAGPYQASDLARYWWRHWLVCSVCAFRRLKERGR